MVRCRQSIKRLGDKYQAQWIGGIPLKKDMIAMILAGGQGSRLGALGSRYRIIDFPLSNCTNSGIDTVGVLTQYQPLALNTYVGNGHPWDLDRSNGGAFILPPYQHASGSDWYKNTANAIYQNIQLMVAQIVLFSYFA